MRNLVWLLVIVLFVVHQDFWFWDDRRLMFGFMPIGLFYHVMFSIAAALVWLAAVRYAWPHHIEDWADEFDTTGDADASNPHNGATP